MENHHSEPTATARWSDPATWGGAVPPSGTKVTIHEGMDVLLDVDIDVTGLEIHGTLEVWCDTPISIRSGYILVHEMGKFLAHWDDCAHNLTITLTGTDKLATPMGGRVFGAMMGGRIELIGKVPERTWTQLADGFTAGKGATSITLEISPGWKLGDEIMIASTDLDYAQTEIRTIAGISGNVVTLDRPLDYLHYGVITRVEHGKDGIPTAIDERAEVGLLSHYIKIQGAEDSENDGYGGHVMVMDDASVAALQGVEFFRMGQFGLLGRYPMHWHNVNDGGAASFMRNCSTHHSFNRGTTIHKTNNLTISDNVVCDTKGHGYFFEDGKETGNTLTHNLVALVHRGPLDTNFLLADSHTPNTGAPAAFWITNPNNTFIDNAAAGVHPGGFGFWYDLHSEPRPGSISADPSYHPNEQPFGVFRGNRAHSIATPWNPNFGEAAWGFFLDVYTKQFPVVVEDFTTFKIQGGQVWSTSANPTVIKSRLSGDNVIFNGILLKDSLAVGRTKNPVFFEPDGGGSHNVNLSEYNPTIGRTALVGYDLVGHAEHSVFAGFRGVFKLRPGTGGGAVKDSTFINDASFKTYFIGNVDDRTADEAERSMFTLENPEDSFGNGAPGLFTYTELYTVAGSKKVSQGAKGLEPTDVLGWWSPARISDFVTFGFDHRPGDAPYQVVIQPAGKDKLFAAVPTTDNNGGVIQNTVGQLGATHRITFVGLVDNENISIQIGDGINGDARFLILALPPSSTPIAVAGSTLVATSKAQFDAATESAVYQDNSALYIKILVASSVIAFSGYTVSDEPPEPPVNHDGDVDVFSYGLAVVPSPGNGPKGVTASIQVRNKVGASVSGVTVSFAWSGAVTQTVSGTTNAAGSVSFTTKVKKGATITGTISNLSGVYDPSIYPEPSTRSITVQ